MSLHLIESTRQEVLAERLVARLGVSPILEDSLGVETVVVQNAGLGRWLRLWHAKHCGISAAVEMPFAQSFISRELERQGRFDRWQEVRPQGLRWGIFDYFQKANFAAWDDAGPLTRYLDPELSQVERRRWSLAGRLAVLYDRYAMHRPEWVKRWLKEGSEDAPMAHLRWQARLLREVVGGMGLSFGDLERSWIGLALWRANSSPVNLPHVEVPLHVFGISTFPAAYLRFFQILSARREVYLYHLIPSEAYLGELPKNHRAHLLAHLEQGSDVGESAADLEHPLLVANGQAAARFQSLLLALDYPVGELPEAQVDAPESDLQALQQSVRLNQGHCVFSGDGSVSVHSCHSRMREVQVLQQQLLGMLAADPDLRPEAIMVLVPEIDDYADAIHSVFTTGTVVEAGGAARCLPYCIADQQDAEYAGCWQFFSALLAVLRGRQLFSEVATLLDFDPVCRRLGLSRDDFGELRWLLQEKGIRWGIDGPQRRDKGLPEYDAYSWENGLQQLFDAMIFGQSAHSKIGAAQISGQMEGALGALTQLLGPVFSLARRGREHRSFVDWSEDLLAVLRQILGDSYGGGEWMRVIAVALGELRKAASDVPIRLDTFCAILEEGTEDASGPSGLLRRGITFCRMQPARHIPARVVCLLGLNEGSYPRRAKSLEFDLIDWQRRHARKLTGTAYHYGELEYLSDSEVREADRQLFMDCLANARDRIYISYIGQSEQSNETLPPSILVSELLQFLGRTESGDDSGSGERASCLEQIRIRHPLQDWSGENFRWAQPKKGEPPVPLSFNAAYARMAPVKIRPPASFLDSAVAVKELLAGESRSLKASQLLNFLKDPAKDYLQQQLKLRLDLLQSADRPEDVETFELDGLGQWDLRSAALDAFLEAQQSGQLADGFAAALKSAWQKNWRLPPGHAGDQIWRECVEPVLVGLKKFFPDQIFQKKGLAKTLASVRFENEFWECADGRRLIFINGDPKKPKYLLQAFTEHIGALKGSFVLNLKDQSLTEWPSFADADELGTDYGYEWLRPVLELWVENTRAPVPFSMEIAYYFANKLCTQGKSAPRKPPLEWLNEAYEAKWTTYNVYDQDCSDAQLLCFEQDSPAAPKASPELRESFMRNARLVFEGPINWAIRPHTTKGGA